MAETEDRAEARIRILITAAAHHEQRHGARMRLLNQLLGMARVVAMPLLDAHRRVVAGITKNNRAQLSGRRVDREHGHIVIHHAFGIRAVQIGIA